MRITLKHLENKLNAIKGIADRKGITTIGNGGFICNMRIQSGPGGKRIVTNSLTFDCYEITGFMPARELNLILSGMYLGLEMR